MMFLIPGMMAVVALFVVMDVYSMRKRGLHKELLVSSLLFLCAISLTIAKQMRLPLSFDWLFYWTKPISDSLNQLLQ